VFFWGWPIPTLQRVRPEKARNLSGADALADFSLSTVQMIIKVG
jgi:hypothetical protein